MNKRAYPIPPTNAAFSDWTEIDVPVLTHTHDDAKRRSEERTINFNERMCVLDYYIEDATADTFQNSPGNPWHVVCITQRDGEGNPFHFFCSWYYPTREQAILAAKLANWFRHDQQALDAALAQGGLEEVYLSCELEGKYGREYWIERLKNGYHQKLSTLIRRGMALRPFLDTSTKSCYTPPIDAIYEALTDIYPAIVDADILINTIHWHTGILFDHPDPYGLAIGNEIVWRADNKKSRQEIADWLESIDQ